MSMTTGLGAALQAKEKLYVFAFDQYEPGFNVEALLAYMRDARPILSWSYVVPSVFLIRSYETGYFLSEALRHVVGGGARCLVIEATATNMGGWLPKPAWDWIERVEPKPETKNALSIPNLFKK